MISNKLAHHLKEVLYIMIIWLIATFFYVFIKFNDIPDDLLRAHYHSDEELFKNWLYTVTFLTSIPLGILLGFLHTFIYPKLSRNKTTLTNILIRTAIFFMLSFGILAIVFYSNRLLGHNNAADSTFPLTRNALLSIFIYMIVTENLVSVFITLRRDLGGNFFKNIIVNTYRNPREETRVFMFLDMENSTPTVYKLGHLKFSSYIQDCFYDLSDIVLEHRGEIYQFVGDEAIITWKVSSKFDYRRCVDLYFAFRDYLNGRQKYYETNYGISPGFRCAIHMGKVSTALVGEYSREIAFHGNVLNLCARLQAVCKDNNAEVLVSDTFLSHLDSYSHEYIVEQVYVEELKGIPSTELAYKIEK